MVCVLVLLVSAVPANAADNLDVPVWYGGAVKAFDRMGSTSLQLPWWISKGTAKKILQLKDNRTFDIDAKLDDQGARDGYPTQKDFDQALNDHASVIRYQDKTFEMREWLNLLGQTFADGYADSANGSKVYGDTGYIPTSEEIDQESQKLAHTSSYLLQQAKNFDYDASSAQAETSGCRAVAKVFSAVDYAWKQGEDTPGTYLASDVIPYDESQFKNYDALTVLDRDGGVLYYDQIVNEMSGKKSSIIDYSDLKPSAVVGGRKAQAKQWAGKAKELGKEAGKQGLLEMIDQFVGGMIQDGSRKVLDMTVGLDNWCDSLNELSASTNWLGKAVGYIDNKFVGTVTGVDCDDSKVEGTVVGVRQWRKAKKDLSQSDDSGDLKKDGIYWKRSWMPWYHASTGRGDVYIRPQLVSNGEETFVDVGMMQVNSSFPENYADVKWDSTITGKNWRNKSAARLFFPHALRNGEKVKVACNTQLKRSDSCYVQLAAKDDKGNVTRDDGFNALWTESGYAADPAMSVIPEVRVNLGGFKDYNTVSAQANTLVKGTVDWVMSHIVLYDGSMGYIYDAEHNDDSMTFSQLADSGYAHFFTACGDGCPAAYQPSGNTDMTTTTTSTDPNGTQRTSTLEHQNLGNGGLLPRKFQTQVNDDGTIGGTLSFGAGTGGKTTDLGSMSLDGIKPNATGKRLDLIDTVTGKSCFEEGYACADWVKETQTLVPEHQLDVNFKGTTKEYPNLKYKCSYDVPGKITEVPLGECIAYAPQFKPEAQKSGQTTGQPDGSTSDKTTTKPDTSYSWNDCVKSATSETAAAWLYSPVTCAAHQLFIPETKVMTTTAVRFQRDTSDGIMPQFKELQTNWGALFQDFSDHGCHGVFVSFNWADIPIFDNQEVLNACPGSDLEFLPVLSKAAITIGLAVMAFSICRKAVMAIFDFNIPDNGGE